MEHSLRPARRPHHVRSAPTRPLAARILAWVWPSTAANPDAGDHGAHGDDNWSVHTMRWVPVVIPLTALGMLLLAVLIGTRLY